MKLPEIEIAPMKAELIGIKAAIMKNMQ